VFSQEILEAYERHILLQGSYYNLKKGSGLVLITVFYKKNFWPPLYLLALNTPAKYSKVGKKKQ